MASAAYSVLEHVRSQRDVFLELLRRFVDAESPSTNPESHRPVRRILAHALGELDFVVREVATPKGYRHVYARPAERKRGTPSQLLVGHYDTVWPIGTVSERPFTIDDDIARGPGTFDMKGGLAQMIVALRTIRDLGLHVPLAPVVFVNADEEIGSRSSTRYIRLLAAHVERAFVLEPALGETGDIKTERKGIGRFTISVYGKEAHAGLDPGAGASAILELSHVIQALFAMNDPARGVTINVGTVDGGIRPNVIAAHSTAVVDVRVPSLADGERIERDIHALEPVTPGVRLRIDGAIGRPSMEATPRNRALWSQAQRLGRTLGLELASARAGGGSDGNTVSQYTATLDGLGPVGHGAHAKREFLYIARTLERAALLVLLLTAPVAGSDTPEAAG